MSNQPSELFTKLLYKQALPVDFYKLPEPKIDKDYETGLEYLSDDQDEFHAAMEKWILDNESLIVNYLKAKHLRELDISQEKFNFVKDL